MYYVYAHTHPLTKQPFYIGKGTGQRMFSRRRSPAWRAFVAGLESSGLTYSSQILHTCETEHQALLLESQEIQKHLTQGIVLFNQHVNYRLEPSARKKLPPIEDPGEEEEGMPEAPRKSQPELLVDYGFVPSFNGRQGVLAMFVKSKRKAARLTQMRCAEVAGVGLRFIRELENGKPTLRIDVVNKVLHLFGHQLLPGPSPRD